MRIGFEARALSSGDMRGLVRYTVCLLRALTSYPDIEIVLFAREPLCPEHLDGIAARVRVVHASRETVWNDWALPQAIREEAIDVFHAPADRGLPMRKPCPFVVTVHDSYERTFWRDLFPTSKRRLWYWKHELVNYHRADAVLTVSETARNDLAALGVAPASRIRAIHLAAAPEFTVAADPADEAVRHRYGIDKPYLLYVGGYDRRKNVEGLVNAFDAAALDQYELVIVAAQHRRYSELSRTWRGLSCVGRLRLVEAATSDLPAIYRGATLFVNGSLWESFSLQTLEAMACGIPVLASNRKAIPEIADGAAVLFDPDDHLGLAELMKRTVAAPERRAELRARGLERAREFSWATTASRTRAVYEAVRTGAA